MALSYTKPNTALLRELRAVASHADELQRVLMTANVLPEDFPVPEINLLTKTLIGLPEGTAEGCKEILDYGRVRLADIGQQHIRPEDDKDSSKTDDDTPPALARGMAVDQAIGQLVLSISYAQAEYSRQSGEEIDDDSGAEPGVRPGSDLAGELTNLRGEIQSVEGELEELGRHISCTTLPTSERANQLDRQTQDASGHAGIARNELDQPKPKPGRLERINRVLARLPDLIEKTGKGMKVGIDIALPFADQWFNKLPTDIFNLVVKHLRLVADNIDEAGQRLKKGLEPPAVSKQQPIFSVFRDIDETWCPEMVFLPASEFLMGSPKTEGNRLSVEGPQHAVTIKVPFALGCYPVNFDEYDHFCEATCREKVEDEGWGRGNRPIVNVGHGDAKAYCAWLSDITGSGYHLPSEAQWEYACRAGTTTAYSFGNRLTNEQANFARKAGQTSDVGSYAANAWGLYDMYGNVWEWCADHWHDSYEGAPTDGSAWLSPPSKLRVVRGGSWFNYDLHMRSAYRYKNGLGDRHNNLGFRCAGVQEES